MVGDCAPSDKGPLNTDDICALFDPKNFSAGNFKQNQFVHNKKNKLLVGQSL